MYETQEPKKLILVCTEETMVYANFLLQLISQTDDEGETVVGVKDGSVVTAVWTEKEFHHTRAGISSQDHVLFIGESKIISNECKMMPAKFNDYGMAYGWLGKRGFMRVDKKLLKKKDYEAFISFAKGYQEKLDAVKLNFLNDLPAGVKWVGVFLPVVYIPAIVGIVSDGAAGKKVHDQQYICLTLKVYVDALQKFMEG